MAIVVREKVLSGYNGNMKSLLVVDGSGDPVSHTNGVLVTVSRKFATKGVEFQGELVPAMLTKASDFDKEVFLVDSPVVHYDERSDIKKDDWLNKEGVSRGFALSDGDYIALTADLLPANVAVGNAYVAGADGKLQKMTSPAHDSARIIFHCVEAQGKKVTLKEDAYAFEIERV